MNKQVSDRNVLEASIWSAQTIGRIGSFGRHLLILLALTLSIAGSACTRPDGDTQCGTPEMPCDEIVTDDILEG